MVLRHNKERSLNVTYQHVPVLYGNPELILQRLVNVSRSLYVHVTSLVPPMSIERNRYSLKTYQ